MKLIKSLISKLRVYLRNKWIIAGLVLLVIVLFFYFRGGSSPSYETVLAKRGTVSELVSVTGKVKSAQSVNLTFEQAGKVVKINNKVGDRVKAGDVIVELDHSSTYADLAQAQAAYQIQSVKLSELEQGVRQGQLNISASKATTAKLDLTTARKSYLNTLQTSLSTADDAIHNKVDNLFANVRTGNPQLVFAVPVTPSMSISSGRSDVEDRLDRMQKYMAGVTIDSNLSEVGDKLKQDLGSIKLFLDNLASAVNPLTSSNYVSQTSVDNWKSYLSTARTNINSAISNILTAEDKLSSAENSYSVASSELGIDSLGRDIESQQAQVTQAVASVASAKAKYEKTFLRTPIEGIVAKQEAKLGEVATANELIAAVISDAQFEIEAYVPEADLSRVREGDSADVTLDAYGSDLVFDARVVSIEPAETVIDGVPTYKTIFQFANLDERIRSGMTASVDVTGVTKDSVVYVPQRAVIFKSGKKVVLVPTINGETKEVEVKTGIRGSDGSIEIMSGLAEGDKVVINKK